MKDILVLYYSNSGATRLLAKIIALGIESIAGFNARLRTVPKISQHNIITEIPKIGDLYVTKQDLEECVALALGSPVRFGNMAAPLKYFWDSTSAEWLSGVLIGKAASLFTSCSSMHGGHESTLLTMMLPLIHHGMIIVGVAYDNDYLMKTIDGGTPYGVSHLSGINNQIMISDTERAIAFNQGKRLAQIAMKLTQSFN